MLKYLLLSRILTLNKIIHHMLIKIGWHQHSSLGSFQKNLEQALTSCHSLADQGAKIAFLPELCLNDYFAIREDISNFKFAITIQDPAIQSFQKLAKDRNLFIFLPIFEKRAPGVFHNSCLIISDQGKIMDLYRKMHIPDDPCFYEKYYFTPGDLGWRIVEIAGLKIGVLICWDQWFPEAARINAMRGAQLLYYPTAIAWDDNEPNEWYEEQTDSWRTILRSHSIANGCFTLAVNRVGQEENLKFWGNSFLSSPTGKIETELSTKPQLMVHPVETDKIEEQRLAWPFFRDRRIDYYDDIKYRWLEN